MYTEGIPTLRIGGLQVCPPVIQGGMGVRISGVNLASAVANAGCVGVIATAGLGQFSGEKQADAKAINEIAIRAEIRKARTMTDGIIGVNIMVALSNYDDIVKIAVEEKVDMIISGAGLPFNLPELVGDADIKLVPIVSSAKALRLICQRWQKRSNRLPDAVVVEGAKAGGHLGYPFDNVENDTTKTLDELIKEVVELAKTFEPKIPVIAAGGVYDGADIAHFLELGAAGVQMATRFVCTEECDAHDNFKQAYLDAGKTDTAIIKSPVGLPGRVIKNSFVEGIKQGKTMPFRCAYKCLRTCDPKTAPYCIAQVLNSAAEGDLENSFAFAGTNAYRCNEIVKVKELIDQLKEELKLAFHAEQVVNK